MPNKLLVTAASWEPKKVPCTFAVTANGKALAAVDPAKQIYDIPAGTTLVEVTATPTVKEYWPANAGTEQQPAPISLMVAGNGSMSPKAGSSAWVTVTAATGATKGVTQATINMTRFKEVTARVFDLLQKVPVPRAPVSSTRKGEGAPGAAELKGTYGTWPPANWAVNPVPKAHYLDRAAPWNVGADALNIETDPSLKVNVENIVLELAGVPAPRLYGVTWPTAIAPKAGADPPPILLFFRQTCGQDAKPGGVFTGGAVATQPYPYNFDYAERCLFESLHYGDTPLFKAKGWTLRPKGVPYQIARSGAGAKLVTVFPVAAVGKEYGMLNDMAVTGKILEELQAFMFWRAGVRTPPKSLGTTMIAAFSSAAGFADDSGTYLLAGWLVDPKNRTSSFLKNTVKAIYFLDPPHVPLCVTAALSWADWAGADKRIRLYSRKPEQGDSPALIASAFRKLLGLKPGDPALPAQPYFLSSPSNTRTVASLSKASWEKTLNNVLGEIVQATSAATSSGVVLHFPPTTAVAVGMSVSGPGIASSTTVSSLAPPPPAAANSVTLSQPVTGAGVPAHANITFSVSLKYWDVHHLIAATVLTHALAQGDI